MKKLLRVSSVLAVIVGATMIGSGAWGIFFTYKNIAQEKIVTPVDASIPGKPVRGPFTLRAQADIIREHTLELTEGKTFAEMPRQIPKMDNSGQPIVGVDGEPVMTPNTARDIWITATTLTNALNLGIISYAFSGLVLLFGCIFICAGIIFRALSRENRFS